MLLYFIEVGISLLIFIFLDGFIFCLFFWDYIIYRDIDFKIVLIYWNDSNYKGFLFFFDKIKDCFFLLIVLFKKKKIFLVKFKSLGYC